MQKNQKRNYKLKKTLTLKLKTTISKKSKKKKKRMINKNHKLKIFKINAYKYFYIIKEIERLESLVL